MPSLNVRVKKLIIGGIILLACVGAWMGDKEIVKLSIVGLLALLTSDKEGD